MSFYNSRSFCTKVHSDPPAFDLRAMKGNVLIFIVILNNTYLVFFKVHFLFESGVSCWELSVKNQQMDKTFLIRPLKKSSIAHYK